ncbi:hypothetical protein CRI93_03695 [Longimonas halophila]|uniref:OmpA-like domain-containing protein n=1 Tax=Longimonas halophila TaxID=1469170 RepID=A0A2H3NP97_9BACT|nr:OmpA family protein [Longimonas halophila]PEN08864.1 hypothetical protein CRI93_03695 [Longimonas halophila]
MMRCNTLLVACLLGLAGAALVGCASSAGTHSSSSSAARVDSLKTANERLEARVRLLSDSLQFYDDIQSGQYRRERRALQDDLTRIAYEVQLLREGGYVVATLATDVLFESGTAHLKTNAHDRLRTVATQLRTTYRKRTVRVESYTDASLPADSPYSSARALSAGHAAAIVDALVDLSNRAPSQFQAVAYGDTRPAASNETSAGQARNRRIRITVLPQAYRITHPYETAW